MKWAPFLSSSPKPDADSDVLPPQPPQPALPSPVVEKPEEEDDPNATATDCSDIEAGITGSRRRPSRRTSSQNYPPHHHHQQQQSHRQPIRHSSFQHHYQQQKPKKQYHLQPSISHSPSPSPSPSPTPSCQSRRISANQQHQYAQQQQPYQPRKVSGTQSLHSNHRPSRHTSTKSRSSRRSSYRGRRPSSTISPYRPTASPDADPDVLPIRQPAPNSPQTPAEYLTTHQVIYLLLISSFLPLIISALINFAIAYGMYSTRYYPDIYLWSFPSTLAGDAAVTILLTCTSTWFIEYVLVRRDVRTGGVAGWRYVRDEEELSGLARWFLFLGDDGLGESWGGWLLGQLQRVAALTVACMVIFWPATVGILIAVGEKRGNDWVYEKKWTAELFKLVLGGILGGTVTPVMAMVWIMRGGIRWNEQ